MAGEGGEGPPASSLGRGSGGRGGVCSPEKSGRGRGPAGRIARSLAPRARPAAGGGGPGAGEGGPAEPDRPGPRRSAAAGAPQDVPQPGGGHIQVRVDPSHPDTQVRTRVHTPHTRTHTHRPRDRDSRPPPRGSGPWVLVTVLPLDSVTLDRSLPYPDVSRLLPHGCRTKDASSARKSLQER